MGACEACDGLGQVDYFDESRVVAHPELSLASGAIKGWDARNQYYFQMLATLAQHYEFEIEAPFGELPQSARDVVLNGSGETEIAFAYTNERGRKILRRHPFEGVIPNLQRRFRETDSPVVREELGKLRSRRACPVCEGTRLRREARYVFIGEGANRRAIYQIAAAPLREAFEYFERLDFVGSKKEIAEQDRQRDRFAPAFSGQRRAGLFIARPLCRDAVGRRSRSASAWRRRSAPASQV